MFDLIDIYLPVATSSSKVRWCYQDATRMHKTLASAKLAAREHYKQDVRVTWSDKKKLR